MGSQTLPPGAVTVTQIKSERGPNFYSETVICFSLAQK